jgi:hypothetical protein
MVAFLQNNGSFKYGEVNIEVSFLFINLSPLIFFQAKIVNKKTPFETPGIAHLLRLEYFATKGSANVLALAEIVENHRIKPSTIALMLTVVHHDISRF